MATSLRLFLPRGYCGVILPRGPNFPPPRTGRVSSKFRRWKIIHRFSGSTKCYPCQGGKENGCWKIGPTIGNAAGFSPLRPPQPSGVFLKQGEVGRNKTGLYFSAPRMTGQRSHWTERGDDYFFLRLAIVLRLFLLWLRMGLLSWHPLVWILYTQVRRSLRRKWPK